MKIRNKLTYSFALIVASIILLFSISIYYFSALYRAQEFNKRLTEIGLTSARLLIKVDEVSIELLRIIDNNNFATLQNQKISIYNSKHEIVYTSDNALDLKMPDVVFSEIVKRGNYFFKEGDNEVAGILYTDSKELFFVIVSAYDKFGINKLKNLRFVLIIGFFISVGFSFLSGWFFSGQALKPISRIINEVKKITASNLNLRVNTGKGMDEIVMLAITFNQLLERIEYSFEMQKSFVSNASHELRTPLSIMRAQLEFASQNPRTSDEYTQILDSLLVDLNNMISLSNGLLDLAHVESEKDISSFRIYRIDEIIFQAISELVKKYPPQKISFNIEDISDDDNHYHVAGIESLLKTAVLNIIDNACKYSDFKPVTINVGLTSKEIIIAVIDSGAGIDNKDLQNIYDPFFRGSNVINVSGHGIGLPLSAQIIRLHKGKLEINSKILDGTTVKIYLPKLNEK